MSGANRFWSIALICCNDSSMVLLARRAGAAVQPSSGLCDGRGDHVRCGWCLVIGGGRIRHDPANLDTDENEET
jgi:hypothetical protein